MNIGEQILAYKELRNNGQAFFIDNYEDADRIIEALEKQVPKKPDLEGDGYDPEGNLVYDTWICPCCGKHYEVDYEEYNHCPECGQAIDWGDLDG